MTAGYMMYFLAMMICFIRPDYLTGRIESAVSEGNTLFIMAVFLQIVTAALYFLIPKCFYRYTMEN